MNYNQLDQAQQHKQEKVKTSSSGNYPEKADFQAWLDRVSAEFPYDVKIIRDNECEVCSK